MFVLLGLDQAIVRLKIKLDEIFGLAHVQFFLLSAIVVGFLSMFEMNIDYLSAFFTLFFLALAYILFAYYRLNMHYILAQIFIQGWKIVLLFLLLTFGFYNFEIAMPLSIALIVLLLGFSHYKRFSIYQPSLNNYKKYLITGLHYFFSMLTLTLSLYADQLLLNYDKRTEESSILFTHITFFVSPIAIILGFAGFVIGPYLKNNPEKKRVFFHRFFPLYLLLGLGLAVFSYFLGSALIRYLKDEATLQPFLALALSGVVFLRYLYIFPSAYIGSFAPNSLIRQVSFVNLIGIVAYVTLYFIVSRMTNDYLLSITLSILFVWILRILNGYYAIWLIFQNDYE